MKKIEYYDECPDFILDLMTGECMYQVGEFSCAVDRYDKCYLERRGISTWEVTLLKSEDSDICKESN